MKTVFIVNPKAGQGKNIEKFIDSVKSTADRLSADVMIYLTKDVGDAEYFVKNYCENFGPARFIACGGDGTLNEVVNGAVNFKCTEISTVPMGTGNDFCRNFQGCDTFTCIEAQINGYCEKCDVIKYTTVVDGISKNGYGVNMFNIGFDCNVADLTAQMKKKPFTSGYFAYIISIFCMLIKKKVSNLAIELDGKSVYSGSLQLTSIANGCYCGGGIKSNPLADTKDGLINVNIVKNVSRWKFIRLLPHYIKGDFLNIKGIDSIVESPKCKKLMVVPLDGKIKMGIDCEIVEVGKTEFEIVHNALNFVVPAKAAIGVQKKDEIVFA